MTESRSKSRPRFNIIPKCFRRSKPVAPNPGNPAPIQNEPAPLPSHSQGEPPRIDGLTLGNPAPIQNEPAPLPSRSQGKPPGVEGLILLTDPVEPSNNGPLSNGLDIIAIHGLNGHPLKTWTSPSPGAEILWLRDFLPASLPGSRVFTFGYNSSTFFSHSTGTIRTFADILLADLELARASEAYASRPVVFICHSMGGLVCKRCLIAANEHRDRFQWLLDFTKAIYFFGTPHGGSDIAESALKLAKFFQTFNNDLTELVVGKGKLLRTDLIKELHPDSKALQELSDVFCRLTGGLEYLVSFIEEDKIKHIDRLVVTKKSAAVGVEKEDRIPLSGKNHFEICRIGDTSDHAFRRIVIQCQKIMQDRAVKVAEELRLLNETENSFLASLRPPNMSEASTARIESARDTCNWILSIDQFNEWRDGLPPLLWISGELGCGKTTLMSFLRKQFCFQEDATAKSKDAKPTPVVGSFFCDDKHKGSMQAHIILQGLIYDIVSQRRELLGHVLKKVPQTCNSWSYHDLEHMLKNILDDPRTDGACILIDGLDECDVTQCRPVLRDLVSYLGRKSAGGNRLVNLIVSSRPVMTRRDWGLQVDFTVVQLDEDERIRGFVIGDIQRFAIGELLSSALGHKLKDTDRKTKLEEIGMSIATKSKGSFLWAFLIVTNVVRDSLLEMADAEVFIAECPETFHEIYLKCLKAINPHYKPRIRKTFAILIAARRPLKLSEFKSALAIEANHRDLRNLHEAIDEMENLEGYIQDVLSSLILLDDSTITFRHQGVKDYLLHKLAESSTEPCNVYAMSIEEAERQLAEICINFLRLRKYSKRRAIEDINAECWQDSGFAAIDASSSSSLAETPQDPNLIYHDPESQFFEYAASHWAYHISKSEGCNAELLNNALALSTNQTLLGNWAHQFRKSYLGTNNLPEKMNPLIVSAYFGHTALIEQILAKDDDFTDSEDESIDAALAWASRMGHLHTVNYLLKYGVRNVRAMIDGKSAISWASIEGYIEIARSLLANDRSLINFGDIQGRCPLSLAVQYEHSNLVDEFLLASNIDVNMVDKGGASPIFHTFDENGLSDKQSKILLELLSHEDTNINLRDRRGRTILSHAAELGATRLIQELSSCQERKSDFTELLNDPGDNSRISPLSHAAQWGRLETVCVLCQTKKIDVQYESLNALEEANVFDTAARTNRFLIIEEIAKYYPEGVNVQDKTGRTPLSVAMNQGHEASVRALLKAGADPNIVDHNGNSPLSFSGAHYEMAKLALKEYGVNVNLADHEGHTS